MCGKFVFYFYAVNTDNVLCAVLKCLCCFTTVIHCSLLHIHELNICVAIEELGKENLILSGSGTVIPCLCIVLHPCSLVGVDLLFVSMSCVHDDLPMRIARVTLASL